jgi:hypothetical protein
VGTDLSFFCGLQWIITLKSANKTRKCDDEKDKKSSNP